MSNHHHRKDKVKRPYELVNLNIRKIGLFQEAICRLCGVFFWFFKLQTQGLSVDLKV